MATDVMKVEQDTETCYVCGGFGELMTPEEYDATSPPMQVPLRSMLLHLNSNKVVPDGRLCINCARRAVESYDFAVTLSSGSAPPLSEKIRALRRKLFELTQKIDVFIVVGGSNQSGTATYSEDDIIMVEKDALAAATAADDEDMERARNTRGDTVYQCSVCPESFQRVAEYRAHCAGHGGAPALHSCWTCGAQFATRAALTSHVASHAGPAPSASDAGPASPATCPVPACGWRAPDRAALTAHVSATHGRSAQPPHCCPFCFALLQSANQFSHHLLQHRQSKHVVCGYAGCILRFATRNNLLAHIRKCHSGAETTLEADTEAEAEAEVEESSRHACEQCARTFASARSLKQHERVHRGDRAAGGGSAGSKARAHAEVEDIDIKLKTEDYEQLLVVEETGTADDGADEGEGEVEYLEMETLDGDLEQDDDQQQYFEVDTLKQEY